MKKDCFIGPDWRIPGWMDKGYIHGKLVKLKNTNRWCYFVLDACLEDIKKELREQNIYLFEEDIYLFEEDLKKEDIIFWGD